MQPDGDLAEVWSVLHQRLLEGDLTVSAEIADTFLPRVTRRLERIFPQLDDARMVDNAAEDAILNYLQRPAQYKPEKLNLESYLVMSARWDLINSLKKERKEKEVGLVSLAELVELGDDEAEQGVELHDHQDVEEIIFNRLSSTWENLQSLLPNEVDQQILFLMMDGVRETTAYAEILGIEDRAIDEQERVVKQHKDRIKKTITRHIDPAELKK